VRSVGHLIRGCQSVKRSTRQHSSIEPKIETGYRKTCRRGFPHICVMLGICAALWGCDGGRSADKNAAAIGSNVPKAVCGADDRPEPGLQGQVPAPLRALGGFAGFNCNLKRVGQSRGEGAGWQHAFFTDNAGHICSYYDTSPSAVSRAHIGVVVIDATNLADPTPTSYLTSSAMLDPLESMKVNNRRRLLGAARSPNGADGPTLDLYDISVDCRSPRRVSRTIPPPIGDRPTEPPPRADEGGFSPDGATYYGTSLRAGAIYPIDISDTQNPKLLAEWFMPFNQRTSGLSFSEDGNRAYLTLYGQGSAARQQGTTSLNNGVIIADVSDVQARRESPRINVISALLWGDGSASHQTIPVNIGSKAYLIAVDEGGSGVANATGWAAACAAGLPPWSMARIVDISDERNPAIASKLGLEVNDPKNCDAVLPDLAGLSGFTYGSHYCSVDNKQNATTLACGYLESGIRVFDIRDPQRPREIAYYVPPSVSTPSPGSQNNRVTANGRPDHCSAQIRLDAKTASLLTTCQDNGFLALKFTNGVWPFPTSSTPDGEQN
jgi:hypothetical protein